jgi:glycosyltransferase involved in cell wall biosynthesis
MTAGLVLAVVTEQRCWTGNDGVAYGRKRMGAVAALSAAVPCTLVARKAAPEATGEIVLPGQVDLTMTPWPRGSRDFPVLFRTISSLWSTVGLHRAVVVYCPGLLGTVAGLMALARKRLVVVVAAGNPREALADAVPGIAGRVIQGIISGAMKLLCGRAAVVRYVTREVLQRAYPPGQETVSFGITDAGAPALGEVRIRKDTGSYVVLAVASLDQPYKGVAELIEAVAVVRAKGIDLHLRVAGTGRLRPSLERLAVVRLGTAATFLGHLTGADLEREYSEADYFAIPSWMEGLSRALVEAMAAGLPAVATDVGGARELLEPHRLVPPRDSEALAAAIMTLIENPSAAVASSKHNLLSARTLITQAVTDEPAFVNAVVSRLAVKAD